LEANWEYFSGYGQPHRLKYKKAGDKISGFSGRFCGEIRF